MDIFLKILTILASTILIINVLVQEDKTGGLSGAIAGGTDNIWEKNKGKGYDGILDKIIIVTSIIILASSLILAIIQK